MQCLQHALRALINTSENNYVCRAMLCSICLLCCELSCVCCLYASVQRTVSIKWPPACAHLCALVLYISFNLSHANNNTRGPCTLLSLTEPARLAGNMMFEVTLIPTSVPATQPQWPLAMANVSLYYEACELGLLAWERGWNSAMCANAVPCLCSIERAASKSQSAQMQTYRSMHASSAADDTVTCASTANHSLPLRLRHEYLQSSTLGSNLRCG